MEHWAMGYIQNEGEENERYISESHALMHAAGGDCACVFEAEEEYYRVMEAEELAIAAYLVSYLALETPKPMIDFGVMHGPEDSPERLALEAERLWF